MTDQKTALKTLADLGQQYDLAQMVKPLEWPTGTAIAKPMPYQIWSNNGGSGAPDDPFVQYENFMAFDPWMNSLGEFEEYEDAEQACEDHWQKFVASALTLAPITPAQAAEVLYEALLADGSPEVPDDEWTKPVMDWLKAIAEDGE